MSDNKRETVMFAVGILTGVVLTIAGSFAANAAEGKKSQYDYVICEDEKGLVLQEGGYPTKIEDGFVIEKLDGSKVFITGYKCWTSSETVEPKRKEIKQCISWGDGC